MPVSVVLTTAWPQAPVHTVGNAPFILRGDRHRCHVREWGRIGNSSTEMHKAPWPLLVSEAARDQAQRQISFQTHEMAFQCPSRSQSLVSPWQRLTTECETGRQHDHVHRLCGKGSAGTPEDSRCIWGVFISEAPGSPDQTLPFSHVIRMFQEEQGGRDLLAPGCLLKKCL